MRRSLCTDVCSCLGACVMLSVTWFTLTAADSRKTAATYIQSWGEGKREGKGNREVAMMA